MKIYPTRMNGACPLKKKADPHWRSPDGSNSPPGSVTPDHSQPCQAELKLKSDLPGLQLVILMVRLAGIL